MRSHIKAHIWAAVTFLGVSFIGASTAADVAAEPSQAQQRQRTTMRFQGMDTDGDGRITRAEWRGNARSFRNHDWNNDGVLSGDEVRPGAIRNQDARSSDSRDFYNWTVAGFRNVDRNGDGRITRNEWQYDPELFMRVDRNRDNILTQAEFLADDLIDRDPEDRFDDLDVNNNGRIERDEWHGTREAFDWLDRNNDGRLSRAETVGNDAVTGSTGRRPNNEVVLVDARTRWTDTGIDVRAGERLVVHSQGTIVMSDSSDTATAAGSRTGRKAPDAPFPHMPAGGLIARIGDSGPFFLGDGETLGQVPSSGRLFLGVNDDYLGDNSGEFRVTITTRR
ncbi:hypothetical protein BH24ACI5_BH24ACI5_19100 [soil metagenome]